MTRPLTLLIVGKLSEVNSQCDSFCLVSSAGRSLSAEAASSEYEVQFLLLGNRARIMIILDVLSSQFSTFALPVSPHYSH